MKYRPRTATYQLLVGGLKPVQRDPNIALIFCKSQIKTDNGCIQLKKVAVYLWLLKVFVLRENPLIIELCN